MTRLRGGLVGCGMISEFHLKGWARLPEVEMIALADPDRARAEQRRLEFCPRAAIYSSLRELLSREQIDFIDIVSPPWLHQEHCLQAAETGVHIICQKPLCDKIEDARALTAGLRNYPRLFCVHENHPYRPWFRKVLELRRQNVFGALRFVRLEQNDPREPPEKFKAEAPRGVLLEYGVHLFDMARTLFGQAEGVQSRLFRVNPRVAAESLAHVVLQYREAAVVIDIAWKAAGLHQGSALFIGEEGEAYYEGRMTRGDRARFRVARGSELLLDETRSPSDDYLESFYLFERAFVDALLKGAPAPQPAAENLQTLEMTFAAYEERMKAKG